MGRDGYNGASRSRQNQDRDAQQHQQWQIQQRFDSGGLQSPQLDILVLILVDQQHGMGIEMITIVVFAAG